MYHIIWIIHAFLEELFKSGFLSFSIFVPVYCDVTVPHSAQYGTQTGDYFFQYKSFGVVIIIIIIIIITMLTICLSDVFQNY
jgi:hypothetical protein